MGTFITVFFYWDYDYRDFETLPRKGTTTLPKILAPAEVRVLYYWNIDISSLLLLASSQIPKCVKASMSYIKCVVLASSIKLLHRFILSKHSCKNKVNILDQSLFHRLFLSALLIVESKLSIYRLTSPYLKSYMFIVLL